MKSKSIWNKEIKLPQFEPLSRNISVDVLVIGGGMTGVLCARLLQDAGADCVLVEAESLFSGTSGNTTAKLTLLHGAILANTVRRYGTETAQLYLRANKEALERYRIMCREIDCDFEIQDAVLYTNGPGVVVDRELRLWQQFGYPVEKTGKTSLPFPVRAGLRLHEQAQFHPLKFAAAQIQNLRVYEHTPVVKLRGHTAVTEAGTITAKHIIIATHFPFVNRYGRYFLKLYQHRSYVLALKNVPLPDGMYAAVELDGLSFRRAGDLLLLGGGSHRTGHPGGGWQELETKAKQFYPNAEIITRWVTQDCMPLDDLPYIGLYSPWVSEIYTATGFRKWGMTNAMVAAMLLRDRICGKKSVYESVFDPSRSILHRQLLVNGLETAGRLLMPTVPRCTHMGCALIWNRAEQSWDCPCHGSRFSEKGKRMDNPSIRDLR